MNSSSLRSGPGRCLDAGTAPTHFCALAAGRLRLGLSPHCWVLRRLHPSLGDRFPPREGNVGLHGPGVEGSGPAGLVGEGCAAGPLVEVKSSAPTCRAMHARRVHEHGSFQKSLFGGDHLIAPHPSFTAVNPSAAVHAGWRVVSCPRQAWLLPSSMLVTEDRPLLQGRSTALASRGLEPESRVHLPCCVTLNKSLKLGAAVFLMHSRAHLPPCGGCKLSKLTHGKPGAKRVVQGVGSFHSLPWESWCRDSRTAEVT